LPRAEIQLLNLRNKGEVKSSAMPVLMTVDWKPETSKKILQGKSSPTSLCFGACVYDVFHIIKLQISVN
jgi:hypothetical protein